MIAAQEHVLGDKAARDGRSRGEGAVRAKAVLKAVLEHVAARKQRAMEEGAVRRVQYMYV